MGHEFEEAAARWRTDDAIERRRAERLARDFDESAMEWIAVLVAAAESGAEVLARCDDDRPVRCRVEGIGVDVVVARGPRGEDLLLALSHLRSISIPGAPPLATGLDEPPEAALRLVEVLAEWAGERRRVTVRCGDHSHVGTLRAVGVDVVSLRSDTGDVVYLRAESVSVISSSES